MSDANKKHEATEENKDITAANSNEPQELETDVEPVQKKKNRSKKFLSIAFNIAAGAGAAMATKAFVVSMMMTCTPLSVLLVSSLAVGAAMTVVKHGQGRYRASKNKTQFDKFFTKKNAKEFAKSSGFALIGGAIFMGFQLDSFKELLQPMNSVTPDLAGTTVNATPTIVETQPIAPAIIATPEVQPIAPAIIATPEVQHVAAPVVCMSPLSEFATNIEGHDVSSRVTEAMHKTFSDNIKVAGQGIKDLAYFTFNGFDGVPKNEAIAIDLFKEAADLGNAQAKIDLLYTQFHGLANVVTNPQSAIDTMQSIDTPRAESFTKAWVAMGHTANNTAQEFDSENILSNVKKLCMPEPLN